MPQSWAWFQFGVIGFWFFALIAIALYESEWNWHEQVVDPSFPAHSPQRTDCWCCPAPSSPVIWNLPIDLKRANGEQNGKAIHKLLPYILGSWKTKSKRNGI
jgi:hypothetical protein